MPRIIQTLCDVVPEQGLLIRSVYLRNNIDALKLFQEAQRRAKAIVLDAQNQAKKIFHDAKTQAYAAGICEAATQLVNFLNAHSKRTEDLHMKLQDLTRNLLLNCVSNPEVVMSTFEQFLSKNESQAESCLDLILPEIFRPYQRSFTQRISYFHFGKINIEYRADFRFVLRLGDCVAEFCPDDFSSQATQIVMTELTPLYEQFSSVAEDCRTQLFKIFNPNLDATSSSHQV